MVWRALPAETTRQISFHLLAKGLLEELPKIIIRQCVFLENESKENDIRWFYESTNNWSDLTFVLPDLIKSVNMIKQVFLSSVFRNLVNVRRVIHDQLVNELGYRVWWAEDRQDLRVATAEVIRAVCLQAIEESDIYLAVLGPRYGSDPLGLAFTELEYHHAVSLRIPRFIYLLRSRRFVTDDQQFKQRSFLHLVKDPDLSSIRPTPVDSLLKLQTQITLDLKNPSVFNSPPWDSPCVERLINSSAEINIPDSVPDLNMREAAAFIKDTSKVSFQDAKTYGLVYVQRFTSEPDWQHSDLLTDLDEFLEAWGYVSAWAGVGGPLGQTNIAKVRIVLSQMRRDHSKIYELAGAVASGLYADRRLHAARKWYQMSLRSKPHPGLFGALELAAGNLKNATDSFREVLSQSLDIDNYGLNLGYYGLCLVKTEDRRNGLKNIEKATSLSTLSATTLTRIYRSLAEAHLHVGDLTSAIRSCEYAALIARENKLKGQLRKASKQLHIILQT
jgi:Domain of unknown function (DUF4062)